MGEPKSICVIFNPHAGRRRAKARLRRFLTTWQNRVELWPTEFAGHGVELARRAGDSGFAVVAAAGGDGTAHDVANGLLQATRQECIFAVVPIGSANDYAYSLRKQFGISQLDDDSSFRVDVGLVQTSSGLQRYFVEAIGFGLNGHVTLESRQIQHLQGPLLYGLAAWRAVRNNPISPFDLQWDDGPVVTWPTMFLSVLVGAREGSFIMAPNASLDDGYFDYVHAGQLSRWEVARMLPQLYFRGPPQAHPRIKYGQCRSMHVSSQNPLTIHADGEMFTRPVDEAYDARVELLPGKMRVKLCLP